MRLIILNRDGVRSGSVEGCLGQDMIVSSAGAAAASHGWPTQTLADAIRRAGDQVEELGSAADEAMAGGIAAQRDVRIAELSRLGCLP